MVEARVLSELMGHTGIWRKKQYLTCYLQVPSRWSLGSSMGTRGLGLLNPQTDTMLRPLSSSSHCEKTLVRLTAVFVAVLMSCRIQLEDLCLSHCCIAVETPGPTFQCSSCYLVTVVLLWGDTTANLSMQQLFPRLTSNTSVLSLQVLSLHLHHTP